MLVRAIACLLPVLWPAALSAAAGGGAVATGLHAATAEAALDAGVRGAIELVYQGRLQEAARLARDVRQRFPDDPRSHLLHARILREDFPDQDVDRKALHERAAPVHAALERAIHSCERVLESDAGSLAGYLYRGWAHLFRAQMHALTAEFWSAGRAAKHGKKDLDRVLEMDATLADAHGVLGTYLYFADILPGVVKVARAIVRIPGGDRRRGLEMLRYSAAHDGYNTLDAQALLGVISFAFDGDLDSAAVAFAALHARYEGNLRLAEPLAVMDILRPTGATGLERTQRAMDRGSGSVENWNVQMSRRLRLYLALSELLRGRAEAARDHLELLQAAAAPEPDWLHGAATLALADVHLLLSDGERAAALHEGARDERLRERLRYATEPGAAASPAQAEALRRLQRPASAPAAAAEVLPARRFLDGEEASRRGQPRAASDAYAALLQEDLPLRWRLFRVVARARLAEIQARAGDGRAAEAMLDRALDEYQDRDLLRHVLRARRRFFASGDAARPGAAPAAEGDGTTAHSP